MTVRRQDEIIPVNLRFPLYRISYTKLKLYVLNLCNDCIYSNLWNKKQDKKNYSEFQKPQIIHTQTLQCSISCSQRNNLAKSLNCS